MAHSQLSEAEYHTRMLLEEQKDVLLSEARSELNMQASFSKDVVLSDELDVLTVAQQDRPHPEPDLLAHDPGCDFLF